MMQNRGYLARIEFDEEANMFHGEVVNIRDVITFQGKSVEELKRSFQDSVDDYLEFCAERQEKPEKPFSGRFTIRLSPEQHRKIVLAAEKAGKQIESWVADTLIKSAD